MPARASSIPLLLALLAPAGCAAPDAAPAGGAAGGAGAADALALAAPTALPTPAAPSSGEPHLAALGDGRVLLSWLEAAPEGGHALRFATWEGEAWSEARTITRGAHHFVNWADFPSVVALGDGTLAAHWLERSGAGKYAYGVRIARSTDGGATWSAPVTPHRDRSETEHGFVSLFDAGDGRLGAVWLDGRKFAEAEAGRGAKEMTLRFATVAPDGTLGEEEVLDERVCDCCQTGVAVAETGPVVFYRDRSAEEVRDIAYTRRVDGRWSAPAPLRADGWRVDFCPVNGPQADARGRDVAAAWFSAASDSPRVSVAFSADGGGSFGAPVRVDDGDPAGRVDVLLLEDGSALVSWLERVEGRAEVRARRVRPDGTRGPAAVVAATGSERASGFPRMARAGGRVYFAWTAPGVQPGGTASTSSPAGSPPARVQAASLPLEVER